MMRISIFKKGSLLLARTQCGVSDLDWKQLGYELDFRARQYRCDGVLLDVTELDVMSSWAINRLRNIALSDMLKVRGPQTIITGIHSCATVAMIKLRFRIPEVGEVVKINDGLGCLRKISCGLSSPRECGGQIGFRTGSVHRSYAGRSGLGVWLTFGTQRQANLGRWPWPMDAWFGYCQWHVAVGCNREPSTVRTAGWSHFEDAPRGR